jgi:hypothetical protein
MILKVEAHNKENDSFWRKDYGNLTTAENFKAGQKTWF